MSEVLFTEAYRFSFFQAVRLLQLQAKEREPVADAVDPARETVRFRSHASLGFPPSEIVDLVPALPGTDGPVQMTVAFEGLTGPLGILPDPYTELVIERNLYKDGSLQAFLDLFNHRFLSLFYRAWEKYRLPVTFERSGADPFSERLFHLIGLGTPGLRGRMTVPDQALLHYAGLIAQRPTSAEAVRAVLSDYFGVPVSVAQFHGQWLPLEEENLSRLGTANCELGRNFVTGDRVFVSQSKFRLRVGPLTLAQFVGFLPPGPAYRPIADLTRFLAGSEFDFEVQLVLRREEVPSCQLGGAALAPMLGWTTWLQTGPPARDASEVVLQVDN